MKICTTVLVLFIFALSSATAQSGLQSSSTQKGHQQAAPSTHPAGASSAIDPAKEADIRRLLEVTGAEKLMLSSVESITQSIRPVLANSLPPGEYRDKLIDLFLIKFQSRIDVKQFMEFAIPIYDKDFSHEEIKALIAFYESPLGQKTVSLQPQIGNEMRAQGEKLGRQIGQDSMREVLAEHPDMAAALEAAGQAQKQ